MRSCWHSEASSSTKDSGRTLASRRAFCILSYVSASSKWRSSRVAAFSRMSVLTWFPSEARIRSRSSACPRESTVETTIKPNSTSTYSTTRRSSAREPVRAACTTASTMSFPTHAIAAGIIAWPTSSATMPAAKPRDESFTSWKTRGSARR